MSRSLLWLKKEGGISLETPQRKRAYSHVEGRISWFFLSCGRKLGVPLELLRDLRKSLMLPQESPVTMPVVRGFSGFLSSRCRDLGSHLELRLEPQSSSSADMDLGVPMQFQQGSQASSHLETWNSTFLSRCKRGVRHPVDLT